MAVADADDRGAYFCRLFSVALKERILQLILLFTKLRNKFQVKFPTPALDMHAATVFTTKSIFFYIASVV